MTRYRDKLEWIIPLVEGREVLYIGCVDENSENFLKHQTAQAALQERAAFLLGVYTSDDQIAELQRAGHQAISADVEEMDLGKTFEVIVAADNIEHLSNCGRFLQSVTRHLVLDGLFLVSTPNPTSFARILELLAYRRSKANVEHTSWYTFQVLDQLARRHGLRVTAEVFIDEMHKYHQTGRSGRPMGSGKRAMTRLALGLNWFVCPVFPQLSETFGFILRKDKSFLSDK